MIETEKLISPLIENQFPSFYKEDGPQFIAFVKAYYEWMENSGTYTTYSGSTVTQYIAPNNHIIEVTTEQLANAEYMKSISRYVPADESPLYHTRRLPDYRDIDSTIDEFIVHFKEKYLKNIQFDTATNKKLLVKNSLDLYRSKGSERSVDLFFKLIYGTPAEVYYPAENILKVSDGVWEKPEYLEVTYSKYNVDYVGKQIIGALSGATAFVEKLIRRRAGYGYVNLLYISGRNGNFRNGELLGININNTPKFDKTTQAQLLGSLKRVYVIDKGINFNVGDIVYFKNSDRGVGGIGRVEAISYAEGVIDFIFYDGGYGYTLNANSIISEKVMSLDSVVANTDSSNYFHLFEKIVEPVVNVTFTSASANLVAGDYVYRYNGTNAVTTGRVLNANMTSGFAIISQVNGAFTNTATYYTTGNAVSFYANTVTDQTINGTVMGIPNTYTLVVSSQVGTLAPGQNVYQKNTSTVFARGTIKSVTQSAVGNVVVLTNARGAFKNSKNLQDNTYTTATGTITTATNSITVTGSGTSFNNNYIGAVIFQTPNTSTNVAIGTVSSITNSTSLSLTSNASAAVSANAHSYALTYPMVFDSSTYANVESVSLTCGVYQIEKDIYTIKYSGANNNLAPLSKKIYQYNAASNLIAEGILLTVSHDSGTATGNLTFVPIRGHFNDASTFYFDANTSKATAVTFSVDRSGGDFIGSQYSTTFTQYTNTHATPTSLSYGSGGSFGVGTIGETEVIFIGTDIINSNNMQWLDYSRTILTVASNTGFSIGDSVYQQTHRIAFNPSVAVNATSGFITLPSANSHYVPGDVVRYDVATGNTVITGMVTDDYYYVVQSNTTGVILSYPYRKTYNLNTSNYSTFANNLVNESGHYLYKQTYGTVFEVGSGTVKVKDLVRTFGKSGNSSSYSGTANTTQYANTNLIKYGTTTTNTNLQSTSPSAWLTQANQVYTTLSPRSDAYGFPKNPEGNLLDKIYSCLTFGRFEIGIIGGLNQENPGSDYNINPYVLAHQPYVSAFGRRDLTMVVRDATRGFVVGEKIKQTQANLVYHDLKVDSAAYSNTYDAIVQSFNSHIDVDGTAEFIYVPNYTESFNSNTAVDSTNNTITIPNANLIYTTNSLVKYYTASGNTALSGLSNNSFYYVSYVSGNNIAVSATLGGANVNITGAATGEAGHYIENYDNQFANGYQVLYTTPYSNTVVSGLSNNTLYYVISANTVGFKVATSPSGSAVNLTANSGSGETHYFSTIPGWLPKEAIYQGTTNAYVQSVFSNTTGNYIRIQGNTAALTTSTKIYSYTNPYISSNVLTVSTNNSITATSKGIVKSSTTNSNGTITLEVKRIMFENTFISNNQIIGDVSGSIANIVSVSDNLDIQYPIGLNASIEANVAIANGQVTAMEVIDSGYGYSNGEIIEFVSEDNMRAGTVEVINDGNGITKGYYRSTKGFLSEDMYIHDGDYYQEYSYEILTKISLDRYVDMFKKVMHVAGTKLFGSALIIEESSLAGVLSEIATSNEIKFNSHDDVNSSDESIKLNIQTRLAEFDAAAAVNSTPDFIMIHNNSFVNNDLVQYYSTTGTFVGGLANASYYYVVDANSSGVHLSDTANGTVINITAAGVSEKHYLQQYINPFSNGDLVTYTTSNTALQASVTLTFITNSISSNSITVTNNIFRQGDVVTYTKNSGTSNIGLTDGAEYFITHSNSTSIALANSIGKTANIYSNSSVVETHILRIQKLANNSTYYVMNTTPNTVKLSLTANGSPINITANTTDSGANTAGHYLTKTVEE